MHCTKSSSPFPCITFHPKMLWEMKVVSHHFPNALALRHPQAPWSLPPGGPATLFDRTNLNGKETDICWELYVMTLQDTKQCCWWDTPLITCTGQAFRTLSFGSICVFDLWPYWSNPQPRNLPGLLETWWQCVLSWLRWQLWSRAWIRWSWRTTWSSECLVKQSRITWKKKWDCHDWLWFKQV